MSHTAASSSSRVHGRPGREARCSVALGQRDGAGADVGGAAQQVHCQPPGADVPFRARRLGAADVRADARDELGQHERLGQEVGRPELEAPDLDVDVGGGGQHEHALLRPHAHELAEDHEAVDVAHAQVEHDERVPALERGGQPRLAAEHDVDLEALRAQRAADEAGDVRLVVDDEDAPGRRARKGVGRGGHAPE
jgi:hypothetical protein